MANEHAPMIEQIEGWARTLESAHTTAQTITDRAARSVSEFESMKLRLDRVITEIREVAADLARDDNTESEG